MSRRTPVKELMAEDPSTPSSIRRSTRIAVRRTSTTEDNHDDQLGTTAKTKTPAQTRAGSKSPLTLSNEDTNSTPAKRTRKGSTSSLVEEEIASFTRSSPVPSRMTRRSIARSMSCSPISEVSNKMIKTSTPQKEILAAKPKKGRLSTTEPLALESIKEVETSTNSPAKETTKLTDEPKDEDLPFKKKKAVLLQTITEKSFSDNLETSLKSEELNSSKNGNEPSGSKTTSTEKDSNTSGKNLNDTNMKPVKEKELIVILDKHKPSIKKDNSNSSEKSDIDASLNLHLSDSEHSDLKAKENSLNTSDGSNVSEKENFEKDKTKILPEVITGNGNLESTVLKPKNSINENSFSEPMDVDVTLDTENKSPVKRTRKSLNNVDSKSSNEKSISEKQSDVSIISLDDSNASEIKSNLKNSEVEANDGLKVSVLHNLAHESSKTNDEDTLSNEEIISPSITRTSPRKKNVSTSLNESTPKKNEGSIADTEKQTPPVEPSNTINIDSLGDSEEIIPSPYNDKEATNSNSDKLSVLIPPEITINDDQQDKSPTMDTTGSIIIATGTIPVRRSPRLQKHSESQNSSDAVDRSNVSSSPISSKSQIPSESLSPKVLLQNTDKSIDKNESLSSSNITSPTNIDKSNSAETVNKSTTDTKNDEKEQLNVSNFSDFELSTTLKEKISTLTKNLEADSSSDAESITHYIEDEAEEGEEDTPSEGSNDIIDLGESVGNTASENESEDDSYEANSFIDDDEDFELLSGEEYDLGQTEPTKKNKTRKRVLEVLDSSDEEVKENENKTTETILLNDTENGKSKEDSDMEKMSTQPYCGLTPPSVISVRDSPSESDDRRVNHKDVDENILGSLINKEDNLESLEQIKEHERNSFEQKIETKSPEKQVNEDPDKINSHTTDQQLTIQTPSNSSLNTPQIVEKQRKRLSSINIQENVSIKDISDGSVSDHIIKIVEVFCSTVNKSGETPSGNISLNLSLDYIGSSPRENDEESASRKRSVSESVVHTPARKKRLSSEPGQDSSLEISSSSIANKRKSFESELPIKKPRVSLNASITLGESDKDIQSKVLSPTKKKGKKQKREEATKEIDEEPVAQQIINIELPKKRKRNKNVSESFLNIETTNNKNEKQLQKSSRKLKKQKQEQCIEENKMQAKSKPKKLPVQTDIRQKKLKEVKISKQKNDFELSDSDMSDDLDKELQEKYFKKPSSRKTSVVKLKKQKTKPNEDYKTLDKGRKKDMFENLLVSQIDNDEKVTSTSEQNWQIQYLPSNIKKALLKSELVKKTIGKHESKIVTIKHQRKPKLVPSSNNPNTSWESNQVDVTIRPTTSKTNKVRNVATDFHAKDYKNRMVFDSKRVKRMETKELLKKKEKMKL